MADKNDIVVGISLKGNGSVQGGLRKTSEVVKDLGDDAEAAFKKAKIGADALPESVAKLNESFAKLKESVIEIGAVMEVKHMAEGLIEAQIHMQQIHFTLQAAAGSAEGAAKEFDYVSETAQRLGTNLSATAEEYGRFLISAKSANVPLATTRDMFNAVSEASTVFHLSASKAGSAMMALEQMMGSGVIHTRQLRLELGQALPGVYENFMNLVKKKGFDFNAELQGGRLGVKEWSSDLALAIRMAYKEDDVKQAAQGLNAQLNRMKNATFQFKTDISGGLFEEAAAVTIKEITDMMVGFQDLAKEFGPLVSTIAVAGTAFFAYSKAMNVVSVAGKDFINSVIGRATAMYEESAVALASAEAHAEGAAALAIEARSTKFAAENMLALNRAELANLEVTALTTKAAFEAAKATQVEYIATKELATLEKEMLVAERALLESKAALTASSVAAVEAREAEALANAELVASTAKLEVAQAAATKGFSAMTTPIGSIKGMASGILGLIGGWVGAVVLAVIALKEMHDWVTATGDAVEKSKKSLEGVDTGKNANKTNEEKLQLRKNAVDAAKDLEIELSRTVAMDEARSELLKDNLGLQILTGGHANDLNATLDEKIKKDKENLALLRAEIDANEKVARSQSDQLEVMKKINGLTAEAGGVFAKYDADAFGKETTKLEKANQAKLAKTGKSAAVTELEDELAAATALRKEKTDAAWDVYYAAAGVGKATTEEFNALQAGASAAVAEENKATDAINKRKKALEAAEKIEKDAKFHSEYLKYLTERIKWEKALNESIAKREIAAKAPDVYMNERQVKLMKDRNTLEEQFRKDVEDVMKIDPETKLAYAGTGKEGDAKKAAYTKQIADAYLKSQQNLSNAFDDSERARTQVQMGEMEKAIFDINKIENEFDKTMAAGNMTYAETVQYQSQLSAGYREAAAAIAKMDVGSVEATAAIDDLDAAQERMLPRLKAIQAAAKQKDLQDNLMGLASQAGSTKAADQIARDEFLKKEQGTLVGLKIDPASPEGKAHMDAALGYFDKIQAKAKGLTTGYEDLATAFEGFTTALTNQDWVKTAQEGPAAVAKAFTGMIQQIVNDFIKTKILQMIKQIGSSISGAGVALPGGAGDTGSSGGVGALANFGFDKLAEGGSVSGPGGPKADRVPIMASNGEFVVNAGSVQKYGVGFMEALNDSKVHVGNSMRFADGGLVGASKMSGAGAGSNVNVINATGQPTSTEKGTGANGEEIINVVLGRVSDSIRRNGIVGRSIGNTFGTTRVGRK